MLSYRTIAGVGAAALGVLALAKAGKRLRKISCRTSADCYVKKAAGRVEGIVRKRKSNSNTVDDVI